MPCAGMNKHKEKRPLRRMLNYTFGPRLLPESQAYLQVWCIPTGHIINQWVQNLGHRDVMVQMQKRKEKNPPSTMKEHSTRPHHFHHFTINQIIPVGAILGLLLFSSKIPTTWATLKQPPALD